MPAVSQAQYRFMRGVQEGSIKAKGLSPAKASEWTSGVKYKSLPGHVDPNHSKIHKKRRMRALRHLGLKNTKGL
jgi:hypothetical protein